MPGPPLPTSCCTGALQVQDGGSKVVIEPLVEEDEEVFVQSEEAYETVPGLNIACTVDYELSQRQDKVG